MGRTQIGGGGGIPLAPSGATTAMNTGTIKALLHAVID